MRQNTKKILALLICLVLGLTCLAGCGKNTANDKTNSKDEASTTAQTTTTKPADPLALTKEDFSYGGRNVNGYTNYVDCIEKSGRTRPYWFSEESSYCQKANRGLNIDDELIKESDMSYSSENNMYYFDTNKGPVELFRKYGKADEHECAHGEPSFLEEPMGVYYRVTYHYTQNNRTYYKNFYYMYGVQSGFPVLMGVSYTLS